MLTLRVWPVRACLGYLVTMVTVAALFSSTAALLSATYSSELVYTGSDARVLVIGSGTAKTAATSTVPLYLSEIVRAMPGVEAVSPEAAALCLLDGERLVVVRGIVPEDFSAMTRLDLTEGRLLTVDDTYSALIGWRLAERAGAGVGSEILLVSTISDRWVRVTVVGVFKSATPMDDELIVPLWVGQWLRGVHYSLVSFIRVRMAEGYGAEDLERALTRRYELTITLVHSENGSASGILTWVKDPRGRLVAEGVTDANGTVRFQVPPGLYFIYPVRSNRTVPRPYEVLVTGDEEFSITLPSRLTSDVKASRPSRRTSLSASLPREYEELIRPMGDLGRIEVGAPRSIGDLLKRVLGIPKKALWTLAGAIVLSTLLTVAHSASNFLHDVRGVLGVLRAIGSSSSYLVLRVAALGTLLSAASGVLGCLLGVSLLRLLAERGVLYVALHALSIELDPSLVAASVAVSSILGGLATLREVRNTLQKGLFASDQP